MIWSLIKREAHEESNRKHSDFMSGPYVDKCTEGVKLRSFIFTKRTSLQLNMDHQSLYEQLTVSCERCGEHMFLRRGKGII